MTPRSHARTRRAAATILLASAGLLSLAGCDPRTLLYFLQPYEPTIPPPKDSPSLKGKRVVVVATSASGATTDYPSLDRDLVREFTNQIRGKVKRLDLVNTDRVWEWVEGHPNWTDPAEIAEKFEADVTIYLEVEQFQVQHPGDLNVLHGTSQIHIKVIERDYPKNSRDKPLTDQPKEAKTVYDTVEDTEFPIRGPIPADSGSSRGLFRNTFLKVVATECAWHFVEHDPTDVVQDVRPFQQ